jgi:hypothetical protein
MFSGHADMAVSQPPTLKQAGDFWGLPGFFSVRHAELPKPPYSAIIRLLPYCEQPLQLQRGCGIKPSKGSPSLSEATLDTLHPLLQAVGGGFMEAGKQAFIMTDISWYNL